MSGCTASGHCPCTSWWNLAASLSCNAVATRDAFAKGESGEDLSSVGRRDHRKRAEGL